MRTSFFWAAAFALATNSAFAGVTIQFSEPYVGGIPSNLANSSGTVTNGMRWGILVDSGGNGFSGSGTSYDAYVAGSNTAGFFSDGGAVTDDYFVPGTLTLDASGLGLQEGDFSTIPGNGSIVDDLIISSALPFNGISTGDSFALIWFGTAGNGSAAGDSYGFLTNPSFVIPVDGQAVQASSPFTGNDPIRTASNTFQNPTLAPEPSRVLFLALGGIGLLMRRRRE